MSIVAIPVKASGMSTKYSYPTVPIDPSAFKITFTPKKKQTAYQRKRNLANAQPRDPCTGEIPY